MAMQWTEDTNASILPNITDFPNYTEWDIVNTIVPPYIFTLSVFGLIANSFVMLVFLVHKDRLTVPEIYLGNLALADFILLLGLPFWGMYMLNDFNWSYGDVLCKLVNSSVIVNYYTSIYILVMISFDRYLALVKTMETRSLRRTLYAKVTCVILWLFGLLMSIPTMVHRKVTLIEDYDVVFTSCILDYPRNDHSWKMAHQILLNVAGFALPVLVIVFCNVSIVKSLNMRRESAHTPEANDTKATALVYAVTVLFILCWGPFQVFTLLDTLCDAKLLDEKSWFHILDIGHQFSVYLAFLNSGLNPVLYVFSGQYFRRKVSAIYRRNKYHRRGSDMTTYQRSVVSTYINKTDQIKPVIILNYMKE